MIFLFDSYLILINVCYHYYWYLGLMNDSIGKNGMFPSFDSNASNFSVFDAHMDCRLKV